MKKVMTVVGARPQFIKAAIVSQAFRQQEAIKEILVHTGQHYDANMSKIFFDELDIPPLDYHLSVTTSTHGKQTGEMLGALEEVILQEKPDWLLVYGDTTSTLAAALAAAKLHVPVAHVEAGLRSYNRNMPEEINRLIADQLADILFTPTEKAIDNLQKEGYCASRIIPVGDVMYDAALFYAEKAQKISTILQQLPYQKGEYILATIHRAENTDNHNKLLAILTALNQVCDTIPVLMPLHPRTRKVLEQAYPSLLRHSSIHWIEPVGFLDMILLERNARVIVTDSGGIQKEAFFYQTPCVTLREETEWLETIQLRWNRLVPPLEPSLICTHILQAMNSEGHRGLYPYGEGNAAQRIVQHLS